MSHFDKAESIATNTLLIPEIPLCFFGCDDAMLMIHDAFAEFGPIYTFVPMKGFRRLMIIFQETAHAMKAKKSLDRHTLVWKEKQPFPDIITLTILENDQDKAVWEQHRLFELRVYYGQHFAIHVDPKSASLQVPQFQRNLLISPPGAPCEGWEQIEEDAPNQAILASDLIHAAEVSDYELDEDELDLDTPPITITSTTSIPKPKTVSIVCSKGLEQPAHLPSITVQDWDGHINVELEQVSETSTKQKKVTHIIPTSLPPIRKEQ